MKFQQRRIRIDIQIDMKMMMGSVKIIMKGRISAILMVCAKGFFSSSSRVRYLSSPVSFRSFAAFRRRRTGAKVSGMKRVKMKEQPTKMNRTQ